jgi:hypothetical protein
MNTLVMKKLCGTILLTGCACGAAFAQQSYGTDSATGASPGGASSGMSGSPATDESAATPGATQSGSGAGSSGMGSGSGGDVMTSGAGSVSSAGSGTPLPALTPETPGASGPSDADPYKSKPKPARFSMPFGH